MKLRVIIEQDEKGYMWSRPPHFRAVFLKARLMRKLLTTSKKPLKDGCKSWNPNVLSIPSKLSHLQSDGQRFKTLLGRRSCAKASKGRLVCCSSKRLPCNVDKVWLSVDIIRISTQGTLPWPSSQIAAASRSYRRRIQ